MTTERTESLVRLTLLDAVLLTVACLVPAASHALALPLYMLTNRQKTKGAVMAMCSKVMDAITAKFGEVYVLPSSVDEVLIMPKSAVADHEMDIQDLARMVQQVNVEAVRPEDRLSDNVYEYDPQTQSLKFACVGPQQSSSVGMEM